MLIKKNEYLIQQISHNNAIYKSVIIEKNKLPNLLQFAIANFKKEDIIKPHSHDSMSEVFYICEGKVEVFEGEKHYFAISGDTIIIRPKNVLALFLWKILN